MILAFFILGGLRLYLSHDSHPRPTSGPLLQTITLPLRVDVTLTFDASPDPFAEDLDSQASLTVTCNGAPVFSRKDPVKMGIPIEFEGAVPVVAGRNEFFVRAQPSAQDDVARAARIRIRRGDRTLAEETLWTESGGTLAGAIEISLDSAVFAELPAVPKASSHGTE